ncbi:DNA repair protein RecO [Leucothrix pacifica]|uniref:DNA repair protein RecO n=1 Tax=Leucothrix pacifica TaxID=1247513 RepID=A0A317CJV4_9GAMM|nr:DNA repair protein RecO [Leucothrix pacifica]PWQ97723.1 DNA repair protein RecO [Leucothrix pacifica]
MQHSLGYILRTRPYSDANVIVDLFSKQAGRITCMARPAKLRGKVQKGHLQPFRILQVELQGRGEMLRLSQTDERFRHRIPVANLLYGLYLNELILRLIPQNTSLDAMYRYYQDALQLLVESDEPMLVAMRFELALMDGLGHTLNLWNDDHNGSELIAGQRYLYSAGSGVLPYDANQPQPAGVLVSSDLLIAMREPAEMTMSDLQQQRQFLDKFWLQLVSKPFNSRKLLSF